MAKPVALYPLKSARLNAHEVRPGAEGRGADAMAMAEAMP